MEIDASTPNEPIPDTTRSRSDSVRSRRRGDAENKEETPVKGRNTRTKVTVSIPMSFFQNIHFQRHREEVEEEKIPERPTTAGGTERYIIYLCDHNSVQF